MNWFCYQRAAGGGLVPVCFDEHPSKTPTMATNVIKDSIRPIPEAMSGATLAELAEWARTG